MHRRTTFAAIVAATLFAAGCSVVAPQYSPAPVNAQVLKNGGDSKVAVGEIKADAGLDSATSIGLRANSMKPQQGSYAAYLADALKQELSFANRYAADAHVEVGGVLIKNTIDVGGFSTATGDLQARFIVTRNGTVVYDQVQSTHGQWDSAFAAAIAIPNAQIQYPVLVQKLLGALFADPAFIAAIK